MTLKFYYAPQSSADRVHASLQLLGIPYEEIRVDIRAGETRKPEFLAINPNGLVPTVVIDGTPVFESVAIQIALGERYGVEKGLWPALGSAEHLVALTWLVWNQVNVAVAVFRYMAAASDWVPAEKRDAKAGEAAITELRKLMGVLDGHLANNKFLAGDRLTLADADVSSVLGWGLAMAKIDTADFANIGAWLARCGERITSHSAS